MNIKPEEMIPFSLELIENLASALKFYMTQSASNIPHKNEVLEQNIKQSMSVFMKRMEFSYRMEAEFVAKNIEYQVASLIDKLNYIIRNYILGVVSAGTAICNIVDEITLFVGYVYENKS
jgi:hypothetical protein